MKPQEKMVMMWMDKLLGQVSNGLTTAGQFLEAELPVFVKEYLAFYEIWYIFAVILLTIILCVGITIIIRLESRPYIGGDRGLPTIIGGVILILPCSLWVYSIHKLMLVTFAPRVFLLKEFVAFFK